MGTILPLPFTNIQTSFKRLKMDLVTYFWGSNDEALNSMLAWIMFLNATTEMKCWLLYIKTKQMLWDLMWIKDYSLLGCDIMYFGRQVPLGCDITWFGRQVPLGCDIMYFGRQVPLGCDITWFGRQVPLGVTSHTLVEGATGLWCHIVW
jgi:hypothetical protein